MNNYKNWLFCVLLAIVSIALHFYKLKDWFFFNVDEDWFLFIVRKLVVFKQPLLVGWEMPGGLLTTPVMYYLGAILMFIGNNNPLILAINAAIISVVTTVLIYILGKKLFSPRVALIASIIFCLSYLVNIYGRVTLSLYLGPLLSLITYYALYKIKSGSRLIWLIMLSFVFIFATQEGSLISLIILGISFLYTYRQNLNRKHLLIAITLFAISFIPLITFDLRHDFLAGKRVLNFLSIKKISNDDFNRNIASSISTNFTLFGNSFIRTLFPTGVNDVNMQILPCKRYLQERNTAIPTIISYFILFLLFIYILKTFNTKLPKFGHTVISTHLIIMILGLLTYSVLMPARQYEWFFVLLFPAYSFIIASVIDQIYNRRAWLISIGTGILIIVLIIRNLTFILNGTNSFGFSVKLATAQFIKSNFPSHSYNLNFLGDDCNAYGYRYLLTYLGTEPNTAYTDASYAGWLYPVTADIPAKHEIFLVPLNDLSTSQDQEKYHNLTNQASKIIKIDRLEVLVINN